MSFISTLITELSLSLLVSAAVTAKIEILAKMVRSVSKLADE